MADRTVEDRLREEYFNLLPEIRQVAEYLEVTIRHQILSISGSLEHFERIEVRSRVKGCESAIASLRRRQEGAYFRIETADSYTLTNLKDLAGIRVLVFPRNRLGEIDAMLRRLKLFSSWTADPIRGDAGEALKILGQLSAGQ